MIHHPIKILLIEDNPGDVLFLQETLSEITFVELELVHVDRLKNALKRLQSEDFDVILLDLVLPDSNGLDTFMQIQEQTPATPIVVLTGMADETLAISAMKAGAQDYLVKGQVSGSDLLLRSMRYAIERKRIEATLQQREQEFRTLAENAPDIIARFDKNLRFLYVNSVAGETASLAAPDFLGKTAAEMGLPEALFNNWEEALQRVLSTKTPTSIEFEVFKPDAVNYYQARFVPEFAWDGSIESILAVARDISDVKIAEQKIREQAALIEISPDAIMVLNLAGRFLLWNQGAEKIYGWQANEILGKNSDELLFRQQLSQLATPLQKVIETGEWRGELSKITKSGQEIQVSSRWKLLLNQAGEPDAILTVDRDITEQKQMATQLLRSQRLESLGTLAGGIAHDLNNILTPILAISQLLPQKLSPVNEQNQKLLKMLEDSSRRGAHIVKQILTFARGLDGEMVPLQIKHVLAELESMIKSTFPKSIEINLSLVSSELWLVSANATHLHQVFMNFCVNARDAMPNGGILSISAENKVVDETYARMNLDAKVGSYVVVTFKDTGIGIAPEHIDRIFEPFFTTKAFGEGTGLGLSTTMGIIKNHGGFITVSSEINLETKFQVFLPAIAITTAPAEEILELPRGNGELILVVDDEINIREMLKITLESYNYNVITACDGVDAIAIYAIHQDEVKAILIDVMMPLMDGTTAIRAFQQFKFRHQLKIIACSGVVASNNLLAMAGVKAFLPKPFTTQSLLITLSKILQEE
jgi:two-component system, cell cycle sensor histidine kinase and response regulator CckA